MTIAIQSTPADAPANGVFRQGWAPPLGLSCLFLLATASTFTSLGIVLPRMRETLGLSWGQAGLGFTFMALGCGASAYLPAWLLPRIGVRWTVALSAVVFATAFGILGSARDTAGFFAGCALGGLGFTLAAPVVGEYVVAQTYARPPAALGLYYAVGALGGVVGPWAPWLSSRLWDSWRAYWFALAILFAVAGAIIAALVREVTPPTPKSTAGLPVSGPRRWLSADGWPLLVLWLSFFAFLAAESTINTFALAHLGLRGVSVAAAQWALSGSALATVAGRAMGGVLVERLDPRHVLAASLLNLALGLFGLTLPSVTVLAVVWAALIGLSFGLSLVSATVLLLRYYGRSSNLPLFGLLNTAGVLAAVAPLATGWLKDKAGVFDGAIRLHAVVALAVFLAVSFLPRSKAQVF